MPIWNPWHGCKKISPGCVNCYVYRRDESIGKNASEISRTGDFDLPVKKTRTGEYKLNKEDGVVYSCMTSDFFLKEADIWREKCWDMIRERKDLEFHIITKRIDRFEDCIPEDWGDGWDNVTICSTCENQDRADYRIPILLKASIKHRQIIMEPMLEEIKIDKYLETGLIEQVTCGGESGDNARVCDFNWIKEVRRECVRTNTRFYFKQTGAFFKKDGQIYKIDRKDQLKQADKSHYSYIPGTNEAEKIVYNTPTKENLLNRLKQSKFRQNFYLNEEDLKYIKDKGLDKIREHARDFVKDRLSAQNPDNDGKQTPMRGHPVFKAQHATATCCRSCLEKWHNIPSGKILNEKDQEYITETIMDWIKTHGRD